MILDNIETIATLCDNGNYEDADKLIVAKHREINTSLSFRSALMLSTHNVKHLKKIIDLEAECIILNLEDGVSKELKPKALRLCAYLLSSLLTCKKKLVVRVNALDEGGEEEIRYLTPFMPDAFRVAKICSRSDVNRALALIAEPSELHLSIETKEAWLALDHLRVNNRVRAFYLGILDLLADLELPQSLIDVKNPTMHYLLSHFMITCKALGVKPVSFVFQDYRDSETFQKWLHVEKQMGFSAKGCLSPSQVDDVHDVFGFGEKEIARAKAIVKRFEAKCAEGVTGFSDPEYGFIDEPIYKGAQSVLRASQS